MTPLTIVYLWTGIAAIGVFYSAAALWDAWGDLQYMHHIQADATRLLIAIANFRSEGNRLLVQLTFLVIGLLVLGNVPVAIRGPLSRWGIVAAEVLILVNSVMERRTRKRLLAMGR